MAGLGGLQSFIFGKNTDAPTYEALQRKRKIADMLAEQSQAGLPRNGWEGANMIAKTLASKYIDHKIAPGEADERQKITDAIAGYTGGGGGAGYSGGPSMSSMGGGSQDYGSAIAGIESGGKYDAMGPEVKGDRAYGKYQVMGANIPDWSKEALGRPLTPEQFVADPQAQEAVFKNKFGGYVDQYGPAGAASMWFSGDPTPDGDSDGYTKDTDYVNKFMSSIGGGGGMSSMGGGGGQPDMARISQLADIISNPYATDGQKLVVKALIERELESGGGGMSEYQQAQYALGRDRLALDREKMEAGTREGVQSFGNVYYAERDDPNTPEVEKKLSPYVTNKKGDVQWLELDGATPLPPTQNLNLGTTFQPMGPGGVPTGQPQPIDNTGKAAQTTIGESVGKTAVGLPDFRLAVGKATDLIAKIGASPDLEGVTGGIQGNLPANPLNQGAVNTVNDVKELVSKTFPLAIEALKGLGAMTEVEGTKVTEAVSNLSRTYGTPEFKGQLTELQQFLADKLAIAEAKAASVGGAAAPPQGGPQTGVTEDGYQFKGGDPSDPNNWVKVQ